MKITAPDFTSQQAALNHVSGRKQRADDVPRPSLEVESVERLSGDWLHECEYLMQSPRTIEGKRDTFKKLIWWLRFTHSSQCGPQELRRFLAYVGTGHLAPEGRWGNPRCKSPVSARTVQYYFTYLCGFFRWIHEVGITEVNLTCGLAVPRPPQPQIQPFSTEQIIALLAAARRSSHPRRDEAILRFMLDTGVRASELCGLTMRDLELHITHGQARVLGKGRKVRTVAFSRKTAHGLSLYLRESSVRAEHMALFLADRGLGGPGAPLSRSGLLQLFERLGRKGNLQGVRCSPHTMRHTFAIRFLRRGGDTFTLQTMLGHTALHQTQKYLRIAQADIENKHRQFSPGDEF